MSKKKKILLVRNIHLSAFGGAETYQIILSKCLKEDGFDPIIFSSSGPLLKTARLKGQKAHRSFYLPVQNWSGFRNLFLPLYFVWQLLLFIWYLFVIIIFRPKALQLQSRDDLIAGTLAGKLLRRKVIWTDHSDLRLVIWENIDKKYKNPIGKVILKLANLADSITTVSDYEYQYINRLIAPRKLKKFKVVKNGAMDSYAKYSEIKPNTNSIAFVGRLEDYKGVIELAEAFQVISQKHPNAKLYFYGDGPMRDKLNSYKNKNIFINGYTNKPLKAIAESSIFVLPSYHEGLSLSLIDAAMMRRSIIATNVDGNPEIVVDKKTGLLIPPKDIKSLADALDKFLSSPEYAEKLASHARRFYVDNFDFEKIVKEQLVKLY